LSGSPVAELELATLTIVGLEVERLSLVEVDSIRSFDLKRLLTFEQVSRNHQVQELCSRSSGKICESCVKLSFRVYFDDTDIDFVRTGKLANNGNGHLRIFDARKEWTEGNQEAEAR
jgi:hypothetical protein